MNGKQPLRQEAKMVRKKPLGVSKKMVRDPLGSEEAARAWLLAQRGLTLGANTVAVGQMIGRIMEHYPNLAIPPTLLRLARRTPGI